MVFQQRWLDQLEKRTIDFSIAVLEGCGSYAREVKLRPLIEQIVVSATSLGASYSAARRAVEATSFQDGLLLADQRAHETNYWLRTLAELQRVDGLRSLQEEALSLSTLFQKMVLTLNSGR